MGTLERLERVRAHFLESGMDGVLVTSAENREYFSGFTGTAGYLLITQEQAILGTDFRYVEQAALQSPDYEVARVMSLSEWFKKMVPDLKITAIGFEDNDMNVNFHKVLSDVFQSIKPSPKMIPIGNLLEELRAIKEPGELILLEHAVYIADTAMERVSEQIRPGMKEKDIAWLMELNMRELGADSISFDTIVAAGSNGARPHHRAGDYVVQLGDSIVIDMGAKYEGYCSDMTRTFVLGEASDKFRLIYDTVLQAQLNAMKLVRSGMTGSEIDWLARTVIDDAGFGETFGHSLGHGIGLQVHEFPRVGPNSTGVIEDGMVFSIEPGIYITGWGGVRIEDLIVMEKGHARNLNNAHKEHLISL